MVDYGVTESRYGKGRDALLDAAIRAVADDGLRRLTYRRVASEAGVGHTLVAHHFGSIDTLVEQALQRSFARSVATISTRPGSGDLNALFAGLSTFAEVDAVDQAFQFELMLESRRRPGLRPHVRRVRDAYVDAIGTELTLAGLEPDPALSHLIYSAAEGLILEQITGDDREPTDAALNHLRGLLRRTARPTEGADTECMRLQGS
ncbi:MULTISPECIES: TetR/AcrR family transcriptional regulator [Rhodococcus]|uniref:TetR family transcriptional regulator n=1 Tax=Rhodococcus oxybenzonivorans TaxID=1990687 RepID=A0AAE5A6D3_9NOCA|nr:MULTISPECIES: TetR family transcriptional regulator [Rhodococcus]MDV7241819.1 TetR family transcriptional regulator [Rhodococcus oxybenzonivorans]MDV7265416.1 TetR family transcriptional regulator [Rhodococcus oxybenzonivorans]MDV7273647.1 TetR family transcriptional regulator [Rhodococcus oxybenzonivorans]MDV7334101.1 TetR family transcriptional regulator [Rhodococcus oxybenzonivorans]MDV7343520.1 TetR family transcriptional regulator [Rhodococcus oxybenzonivorans]